MIHLHLTSELPADDFGPHEVYVERCVLPSWCAANAREAHANILTLLATEEYIELPQVGDAPIPLCSGTVREVRVWRT